MEYDFGERVRQLRKKKGWNQDELAEHSGLSRVTIAKYETGVKKRPAVQTAAAIADALGVSLSELMEPEPVVSENAFPVKSLSAIRVIGSVRCGSGGLALTEYDGFEVADVHNPEEYFWLRVTGDSMEPDIREGQLALVHIQSDVESSELAVVVVDGEEGMLKRVIKRDGAVILQSFNPHVEPRIFTGESINRLRIVGKVVETKKKW